MGRSREGLVRVRGTVVVGGRGRGSSRSSVVPARRNVPVRVPVVGGMVVVGVRAVEGRVVTVGVRRAARRIDTGRVLGSLLMLGLGGYNGGKGQNSDLQRRRRIADQ